MRDIADRATLTREDRNYRIADVEFRDDDETTVTFDGVASTVDDPYTVRDMFGEFTETIVKGSFGKTLKEHDDVRLLVNHDGIPLARTTSKTLTLTAAPHLRAVAPLDATSPLVQTVRSAVTRGDMDQMSIGFQVVRQEWNDDYTERWIRELKLIDVSLVTFPANPSTSASLRSLDDLIADLGTVDPDELRRAIDHLTGLLPPPDRIAGIDPAILRALWDRKLTAA